MHSEVMLRIFVFLALIVRAPAALAEVREIAVGDDLRSEISTLGPGEQLVLSGGTYVLDSRFNITVVGTVDQTIVIRAKDGDDVLIEMNTGTQNVLEIQDSQYLEIQNIRFRGGSHGIRLMNSSFITIEGCEIFETGDAAISANSGGT